MAQVKSLLEALMALDEAPLECEGGQIVGLALEVMQVMARRLREADLAG